MTHGFLRYISASLLSIGDMQKNRKIKDKGGFFATHHLDYVK
jgi:hypothetical protein